MSKQKKKKNSKSDMASDFDVLGSYTGSYISGDYEDPVQDVDDL